MRVGQYEGMAAFDAGYKKAISDIKEGVSNEEAVPVDKKFEMMLIFAIRYACGRQSCAPHIAVEYIMPLIPKLSDNMLNLIDLEMKDHEANPVFGGFGDPEIDKPAWYKLWNAVTAEMAKREG